MNKYISVDAIEKKQERDLNKVVFDTESRYRGQLFTLANKIFNNLKN